MGIRRVVTGHSPNGKAVFASDDVVQPVTTANETLVFALPREIRPARA